jgi:hypothetical protein
MPYQRLAALQPYSYALQGIYTRGCAGDGLIHFEGLVTSHISQPRLLGFSFCPQPPSNDLPEMGDPLSVVASALTVIGSGFANAKGLNTLGMVLGSAGESVRIYAKEIRIFSELLDTIRGELEKDPKHSWSRAEHLTMEILDLCKSLLEATNQLQAKLNPLLVFYRDSPTKTCQIALRIRWVISAQEKLLRYRGFLQALTVTLNTALVTVKFKARSSSPTTW